MAESRHTFEVIAGHLIRATEPLIDAGGSLGAFMRLMARLGFRATSIPAPYVALAANVRTAMKSLDSFPTAPSLSQLLDLLKLSKGIFDGIQNLKAGPAPAGVDPGPYSAEIGDRLFELLLTDHLAAEAGTAFNLLASLNVIRLQPVSASVTRPSFIRTQFNWAELPKVVSSPGDLPSRVYNWGSANFDLQRLLDDLAGLFLTLRFPVRMSTPDISVSSGYLGVSPLALPSMPRSFALPFFFGRAAGKSFEASFVIRPLPAQSGALPGIVLEPRIPSALPLEVQLHPKVKMRVRAGTNAGALFGIIIRPSQISICHPLAPGTPLPSAGVGVGFDFNRGSSTVIFGDPTASRLEFSSASVDLDANFANGAWSSSLVFDLKGFKFIFDPGEGDGFLRFLIGGDKTEIGLPLGLRWGPGRNPLRRQRVVRRRGASAYLDRAGVDRRDRLPARRSDRSEATRSARRSAREFPAVSARCRSSCRASGCGPTCMFEPGNAGPFDIDVGFMPPNGVGLSIDGGGFKGGGFLEFDAERGEYAGTLELTFAGSSRCAPSASCRRVSPTAATASRSSSSSSRSSSRSN